jgi:hypothetical protein
LFVIVGRFAKAQNSAVNKRAVDSKALTVLQTLALKSGTGDESSPTSGLLNGGAERANCFSARRPIREGCSVRTLLRRLQPPSVINLTGGYANSHKQTGHGSFSRLNKQIYTHMNRVFRADDSTSVARGNCTLRCRTTSQGGRKDKRLTPVETQSARCFIERLPRTAVFGALLPGCFLSNEIPAIGVELMMIKEQNAHCAAQFAHRYRRAFAPPFVSNVVLQFVIQTNI